MPKCLAPVLAILSAAAVALPVAGVATSASSAVASPAAAAAPVTTQAADVLPGVRYIDRIFPETTATTDVLYAAAPSLTTGAPEQLLLDSYTPTGDSASGRPAIVFIHGGGFRSGDKRNDAPEATEYAQRGFFTVSINYRLDPGNRCGDLDDGLITDPAEYAVELARCSRAVIAAQHDAQASVRWVRANATALGVDPGRVAVIGFSAGAVTAANLAYRSDDPGDVGNHLSQDSRVQASISASGCNYDAASIGPGDAPMFFLHAEFDMPVPFTCAVAAADAARAAGLAVETMFYYGEATHARDLYVKYKADVDPRWTAFLYTHLDLGHSVPAGTQTVIRGLPNRSAVLSIVMTDNAAPGYVQVLPCGTTPGGSSNLNTDAARQTRAGLAIVDFDTNGEACLYNLTATHLVADLQGYFADGAIDDVGDVRLVDTRSGGAARLANRSQTQLTGRPDSTAVVSVVADQTAGGGYLQVLACGATPGGSSNLNADRPGQTIANLAFVHFDAAGHACVYNQTATHLVVDLQAYLTDGAFDDITDIRALDTRSGTRPASGSQTPVPGAAGRNAVLSLIATETSAPGYVQALPCGAAAGSSSNVNADAAGQTVANLAFVHFDTTGSVCLFTLTGTHLVADVQGYLDAGSFDDIADIRLLDTRLQS